MSNGRKLLYTEERVRAIIARRCEQIERRMRAELAEHIARQAAREAAREVKLAEVYAQLDALKAVVRARDAAERHLAELRHRRDEIVRAFGAEHDGRPLH